MKVLRASCIALLGAVMAISARPALAQVRDPYTLEQVERLVSARLSTDAILQEVRDACINFPVNEQNLARLRTAGADQALLGALSQVCNRTPVVTPPPPPGPSGPSFIGSFLLPGSGQFRTGSSGLGVAVLGATAGAVAFGVLTTQKEVVCATRTSTCEGAAVLSSSSSRPYLIPGVAAAAVISALGAWQARKAGASAASRTGQGDSFHVLGLNTVRWKDARLELDWLRVRF